MPELTIEDLQVPPRATIVGRKMHKTTFKDLK
jgi:hypothetical protein